MRAASLPASARERRYDISAALDEQYSGARVPFLADDGAHRPAHDPSPSRSATGRPSIGRFPDCAARAPPSRSLAQRPVRRRLLVENPAIQPTEARVALDERAFSSSSPSRASADNRNDCRTMGRRAVLFELLVEIISSQEGHFPEAAVASRGANEGALSASEASADGAPARPRGRPASRSSGSTRVPLGHSPATKRQPASKSRRFRAPRYQRPRQVVR